MRKLKLLTAIAASGIIAASLSGCYFFPNEEEILEPPTIDVADVVYSTYIAKIKTITAQTITSGYLMSKTQVDCCFTKYTGQLKTIYVKPGDMVEEGQLLAEFNNGAIEYELAVQKLKVQLAQLNYEQSGTATDRLTLQIEQNTLAQYQDEYDGGKIYAPMAGQVSYVNNLAPGTSVDPYATIVSIVDPNELYVRASTDSTKASVGDAVTVRIGELTFDAVVSCTPREAQEAGESDYSYIAADFTGEAPSFAYLGSISDIVYVSAVSENAVVIPKHLIKTDGDRTFVQVLDENNEKSEVDVVTGISNATEIEIISGLSEGDKVVVK